MLSGLSVNCDRLNRSLFQLYDIKKLPNGGVYRLAFSAEDLFARQWVQFWMVKAGMTVLIVWPISNPNVLYCLRHEFKVIRIWEQHTQPFLESIGLLPSAVLTNTPDKAQALRQVAKRVEAISDLQVQSNVAASAGILAGLQLDKGFINQVFRKEIMQ